MIDFSVAQAQLETRGQSHLLAFWRSLSEHERVSLLGQIDSIDFDLMDGLTQKWIRDRPDHDAFDSIEPVPVISSDQAASERAKQALEAGEDALRNGRVGLVLVAGGQGTRLDYDGPKGAYPIGPVSQRSLFAFHAEKILNTQRRYGCTLPWYIMVAESNEAATRAFFSHHEYFGLREQDVSFFKQRTVPCVGEDGKFFLETPSRIAMNPNGHGGSIPAMVENGITADATKRGIDILSYFQVDNWTVKVADPYFIGLQCLEECGMSCKVYRKGELRESAGVFCLCDGQVRVIEYTELDLYPQLLETDPEGRLKHFAANCAIHVFSVDFIEQIYERFDEFPWHCSHKKIPHIDSNGDAVNPERPNGYKFETFVFDALRFTPKTPVTLEIERAGEFTPIKQLSGPHSVEAARDDMRTYWLGWLAAAGWVEPDGDNDSMVVEISPEFALTQDEFVQKTSAMTPPAGNVIAIGADGMLIEPADC